MLNQPSSSRALSKTCKVVTDFFSNVFSLIPLPAFLTSKTKVDADASHADHKTETPTIKTIDNIPKTTLIGEIEKSLLNRIEKKDLPYEVCQLIADYAQERPRHDSELENTIEWDINRVEDGKSLLSLCLGYSERRIRLEYGVDSRRIPNYSEFLATANREEAEIKEFFSNTSNNKTLRNTTILYCRQLYALKEAQELENAEQELAKENVPEYGIAAFLERRQDRHHWS